MRPRARQRTAAYFRTISVLPLDRWWLHRRRRRCAHRSVSSASPPLCRVATNSAATRCGIQMLTRGGGTTKRDTRGRREGDSGPRGDAGPDRAREGWPRREGHGRAGHRSVGGGEATRQGAEPQAAESVSAVLLHRRPPVRERTPCRLSAQRNGSEGERTSWPIRRGRTTDSREHSGSWRAGGISFSPVTRKRFEARTLCTAPMS